MSQPGKQTTFIYPFGNPHTEQQQDVESYHSVTNDDGKFKYFDEDSQGSFYKKGSQSMLRKKNPLPPVYPYQEMKKLKESIKIQKKGTDQLQGNQSGAFDTQSIRSIDSFHTVNQFQSICYEEGDYEKIVGQMRQNEQTQKNNLNKKYLESQQPQIFPQKIVQSLGSYQPNEFRFQAQVYGSQRKVEMQRSNALDQAQLQQLQNSQVGEQEKYQKFDQKDRYQSISPKKGQLQKTINQLEKYKKLREQRQGQKKFQQREQDDKSVQISRIQQVLNESLQLDQQILQLTRQLQQAQSSQQQLLKDKKINEQLIKRQQQLSLKYQSIERRIKQIQNGQEYFTKQISIMTQVVKNTQQNNNYLKKQIQFFKLQAKQFEEKQKQLQKRQKQRIENELNTSKTINQGTSSSFFYSQQQRLKAKTYHIRPKTSNNKSYQSRKYKELTFQYCMRQQQQRQIVDSDQKWVQLEIDRENNPPEYRLIYSFEQQNTLLVIRLVNMLQQGTNSNNKKQYPVTPGFSVIKRNYQYMIDFASNKYQNQQKKLQSLTKQLIIHLNENAYTWKQFTKKIQVFLIITEEETYVDLVKVVPLPNPIAFYVEKRFNKLVSDSMKVNDRLRTQQSKDSIKQSLGNNSINPIIYKNVMNLHRLMKTFVIKIQHMADVESVQKLMSLQWVNTNSNTQPKYFSIRHNEKLQKSQNVIVKNQLFYVKIENCVLENDKKTQNLEREQYKYSLVFRVASNIDNGLLVDLIEFLTFLTVI